MERHKTRCLECGVEGYVEIGRRLRCGLEVKFTDFIPHKDSCSKYRRPQPKHLKERKWRAQEKRAASMLGATLTPASGAVGEDGDARKFHDWRVECKQTKNLTYVLTQAVWRKLVSGALRAGEEPVLHVEANSGRVRRVVVLEELFCKLTESHSKSGLTEITTRPGLPRKTYRVGLGNANENYFVPLDPPGIEMVDWVFKSLKERMDGLTGSDLQVSPGESEPQARRGKSRRPGER